MLDKIGLEKEVDAKMLMMRMIDRNIHRQSKKCPNADLVLSLGVFLAAGEPGVTRPASGYPGCWECLQGGRRPFVQTSTFGENLRTFFCSLKVIVLLY